MSADGCWRWNKIAPSLVSTANQDPSGEYLAPEALSNDAKARKARSWTGASVGSRCSMTVDPTPTLAKKAWAATANLARSP
ncbi:MAG: hypothetical protein ACXVKJ_20635, partial [Ilumatobacteraceae bacterium]